MVFVNGRLMECLRWCVNNLWFWIFWWSSSIVEEILCFAACAEDACTSSTQRHAPQRYILPLHIYHLLTTHSGYSAIGAEKVIQHLYDHGDILEARKKCADVKESFEVGREDDELMPNIWFSEDILPGFRETCLTFFWVWFFDCFEIERHILCALAIGLGLSEDYFTNLHTKPDNQLRLLHYPRHVEEVKNVSSLSIDYQCFCPCSC